MRVRGALGLGGGVVIVPALLYLLPLQGIPLDQAAPMAVATSLATIAFTSMSAIHTHHRLGALRWPLIARLSLGIIGGALAGAQLASILPGAWLAALFGFFAIVIALQMLASGQRQQAPRPERLPGGPALVAAGAPAGSGGERDVRLVDAPATEVRRLGRAGPGRAGGD